MSVHEPLLSDDQLKDANLMSMTVESLYSPPESWSAGHSGASNFMYTAALPLPQSAEVITQILAILVLVLFTLFIICFNCFPPLERDSDGICWRFSKTRRGKRASKQAKEMGHTCCCRRKCCVYSRPVSVESCIFLLLHD